MDDEFLVLFLFRNQNTLHEVGILQDAMYYKCCARQ
jgi:hypothetical protein